MPLIAAAVQGAYGFISSIPMLLVVDAVTLDLLSSGGCSWVKKDKAAEAFPWRGLASPPPDFGSSSALLPMVAVCILSLTVPPVSVRLTARAGCSPRIGRGSIFKMVPSTQLLGQESTSSRETASRRS